MKKFLSGLFALVMSIGLLAGCNLVELNKTKYYNQTVTEIVYKGDKETKKFTMEELLQAYNTYGYQYVQNGSTAEEALSQTVELMVQRYLLVEKIKSEISLTQNEKNSLKKQTYDSINSQLNELESEIRVEWDLVLKQPEATTEEETSLRAAYTPYEPKVEKQTDSNGLNPVLVRVEADEEEVVEDPGEFVQYVTDQRVSAEAMKRFINQVKENNENLGKNVKDDDILKNEIDRIYGILEENKYISKYQEIVLENAEVKTSEVVESYIAKYKRDKQTYENDYEAYHAAIAEDASAIYYHPNSANTEYMWVTHILFKFSDEQTVQIEKLEADLKSNTIDKTYYDAKMEELTSLENTVVKYVNDSGEVVSTTAAAAYEDIRQGVARFDSDIYFTERAQAFNDYIYKYNDDEGIMNKDFAYVVNIDTSVSDRMVKPFADEARDLYAQGLGSMSAAPVKTEYGYHVLLNLGKVQNIVSSAEIDSLTWQKLYSVTTQPSSTKTLFHLEYDNLALDSNTVSVYFDNLIKDLTASVKEIKYHETVYKTLLTINQ